MNKGLIVAVGLTLLAAGIYGCAKGCGPAAPPTNIITVWHWMTDRHKALDALAQKYEAATGVKVVFELYAPSDVYSQKIIAAAQAKILPDIFGVLDKKSVFATFIKSGYIADLTDEFKKDNAAWERQLFPKALASTQFEEGNTYRIKPGFYGVPIDVTNIQMVYNKKFLAQAGIQSPPATFDEFIAATAALKKQGIAGLVSGWGELWMADCFASNYAFNIMGEERVLDTFRGKVPYTDPDWIAVLNIFQTLREKGALIEGIVTKANKYAEQDFALERAAFAFNGSWCVNVYRDMNPNLEYGVMLPLRINLGRPMAIWGGAGSSFVVNNSSPNKEQAVAFLKWLSAPGQQAYLSTETRNLPANKQALAAIPPVLADFAAAMEYTTHPTVWPLNEDPLVSEAFDKGIQSILIGEKTPEQVAAEVAKVKERQLARQQRRGQ